MLYLDWRFLPLFEAVDPATAYRGIYQPELVAVSLAIAILAACVALSISDRIVAADTTTGRLAWSAGGAITMGGGIWSMHFIGMLAFSLPCGVSYDLIGTVLSMIPGVLASGVALTIISRRVAPDVKRLWIGAVLMGGGIGAMHYSGMAAMRPEATLLYDPKLVAVSLVMAITLAFISLGIRFRTWGPDTGGFSQTLAAGSIMGCGVAGMHYMAMQAAIFFPLPETSTWNMALPRTALALGIVTVTVLVGIIMLISTFAARQTDLARTLQLEFTRRQALERDAETGRARLQAILDGVADGIVTIDSGGGIRQWSSGAQRLFGYTADEVLGADLTMLMPEPHRTRHHQYIASFLATRDAKIIGIGRELSAVRKDGTEFPMELTVNEVRSEQEVLFTGILRDITERKRTEAALIQARQQAEAANIAKSQFLAAMSHEIRTPMNGVIGMANLLSATPLTERQRHLVASLSRSGQSLLGIINDILDFSRIEAGRLQLFEVDFDPRDVIADVTNMFAERCASKGLEFVYFVAEEVPRSLRGDSVRLRQVLINLVGNAIKFTERGEILLEVTVAERGESDSLLAFSVEDTGIGIEASMRETMFESFQQVDHSMTRSRGGSGLGLAISRQLVELMGGQIGVESELGRGSRFHFTVRCGVSVAKLREMRRIERPIRVLLVDSNPVSAHVTSLCLVSWKVDAAIVSDIAEADQAWRRAAENGQCFDVAVIDVKGLGAPGVDFAARLRADKDVPVEVVLMIGTDNALDDAALRRAGAIATLVKPVRPSDLFNVFAFVASGAQDRGVSLFPLRSDMNAQRPQFDARILVAEDNAVNQDVITGLLESMGCRVVTAPNGRSAIQRYAQEKFDLVLMDCEMPILDGLQATKRIRDLEQMAATDHDTPKRMPIVALTAHALADVRDSCLAAGMDDFLVKPFDDVGVIEALRRWIAHLEREPVQARPIPATMGVAIDDDAIRQIRAMGNDGLLQRVVSQFIIAGPPLAATIREKFDAGDGESVWRAAHSLKSSAAALGARRLSQHCADIETLAKDSGTERVGDLLGPLDIELAAALRRLQELAGVLS